MVSLLLSSVVIDEWRLPRYSTTPIPRGVDLHSLRQVLLNMVSPSTQTYSVKHAQSDLVTDTQSSGQVIL